MTRRLAIRRCWQRLLWHSHVLRRRFWEWLALRACDRLNNGLSEWQCTFVITQTARDDKAGWFERGDGPPYLGPL